VQVAHRAAHPRLLSAHQLCLQGLRILLSSPGYSDSNLSWVVRQRSATGVVVHHASVVSTAPTAVWLRVQTAAEHSFKHYHHSWTPAMCLFAGSKDLGMFFDRDLCAGCAAECGFSRCFFASRPAAFLSPFCCPHLSVRSQAGRFSWCSYLHTCRDRPNTPLTTRHLALTHVTSP
jgi:hypothetical protein